MSRLTFDPSCGLDISTTTIRRIEDIAAINSWGYRVVRHDGPAGLFIHEAYYDHDGSLLGIADRPASPCGNTMERLAENVAFIAQAVDEATLNYADFVVGS